VRLRFFPIARCSSAVFTSSDNGPALLGSTCCTIVPRVAVVDTRSCPALGQVALLQHTSARTPGLQGREWRRRESLAIEQHDLTYQFPVAAFVVFC